MKITTESGALYELDTPLPGFVTKTRNGKLEDKFKYGWMKPFPENWVEGDPVTYDWLDSLPIGEPVIGKRLYIGGYRGWWITTPIVKVEAE